MSIRFPVYSFLTLFLSCNIDCHSFLGAHVFFSSCKGWTDLSMEEPSKRPVRTSRVQVGHPDCIVGVCNRTGRKGGVLFIT